MRKPGTAGDIYDAQFLDTLHKVTDDVFFLPGVDRSRVTSLFTPGVRYLEVVEDGFSTGDVIPRNYQPTPERSEEHTSELQSLMRISYAVFCLKKKKINNNIRTS